MEEIKKCESGVDDIARIVHTSFEDFYNCQKDHTLPSDMDNFNKTPIIDWKYQWLAEDVFGLTTYDDNLSNEFGKVILEVLTTIRDRTTFDYIKDTNNYKKFIIVCNMLNQNRLIDWGTSIRGCWFDYFYDYTLIETTTFIKYDDNGEWTRRESECVKWSENAVNYLIDVFFKDDEKKEEETLK